MPQFKNILITGASGFIGKNLTELLGKKYNLYTPARQSLDLLNEKSVENFFDKNKIDVVIHAAAAAVGRKTSFTGSADDSLKMFFNLTRAGGKWKKMIFLGSGAEYDKRRDLKQVKEDEFGEHVPVDEYGFAKYSCSQFIEKSDNVMNLRCFGVYGKYEDRSQRFISGAIYEALEGKPITIGQNVWFDYLFVDDLVKIIDYFINHEGKYKFYNAASGRRVDLVTLAGIVERVSGSKQGIKVSRDGLNREYTADNSRLMGEIKNFKFTSPEEGIKKLFEYYQATV